MTSHAGILAAMVVLAVGIGPHSCAQYASPVIRMINDAATGQQWLLTRDPTHPGGPGRLVRIGNLIQASPGDRATSTEESADRVATDAARIRIHPVIQAGDRVVVQEHSAVVEARLEAVALGSAFAGAEFPVRLCINGKVVHVTALAAGKAALHLPPEGRP